MKLSSFFKGIESTKTKPSSKWPPLKLLKIISFPTKDNLIKNSNLILCDTAKFASMLDSSSCSQSMCCLESPQYSGEELVEMATKAVRSKRLFFQPGNTSSILDAAKFQFKDCVALAVESADPYLEFRKSMEEMVKAYGLKHLEDLEELLALYLRLNRKKNHGLVVGAFIDIFAGNSSSNTFSHYATSSSSQNIS